MWGPIALELAVKQKLQPQRFGGVIGPSGLWNGAFP